LRQLPPSHQLLPDQHLAGSPRRPQSRFINERSHANIQRDGTYSVIPRM
jgi:NAD(P)H-nitrite reductase large subunit